MRNMENEITAPPESWQDRQTQKHLSYLRQRIEDLENGEKALLHTIEDMKRTIEAHERCEESLRTEIAQIKQRGSVVDALASQISELERENGLLRRQVSTLVVSLESMTTMKLEAEARERILSQLRVPRA